MTNYFKLKNLIILKDFLILRHHVSGYPSHKEFKDDWVHKYRQKILIFAEQL
jgi:hypothetical protein